MDNEPRGWYFNKYLPHFDGENVPQFITYRLYDSMPQEKLKLLEAELKNLTEEEKATERVKQIEFWLDTGAGECWLKQKMVADLVQENLLHFHEKRYQLHSWVIMPNHVHVLFTPIIGVPLSTIIQGWKTYTAKAANKILNRNGLSWREEYFDRFIRSEKHYLYTINYIEENPVKAGLCSNRDQWVFSSAYRK